MYALVIGFAVICNVFMVSSVGDTLDEQAWGFINVGSKVNKSASVFASTLSNQSTSSLSTTTESDSTVVPPNQSATRALLERHGQISKALYGTIFRKRAGCLNTNIDASNKILCNTYYTSYHKDHFGNILHTIISNNDSSLFQYFLVQNQLDLQDSIPFLRIHNISLEALNDLERMIRNNSIVALRNDIWKTQYNNSIDSNNELIDNLKITVGDWECIERWLGLILYVLPTYGMSTLAWEETFEVLDALRGRFSPTRAAIVECMKTLFFYFYSQWEETQLVENVDIFTKGNEDVWKAYNYFGMGDYNLQQTLTSCKVSVGGHALRERFVEVYQYLQLEVFTNPGIIVGWFLRSSIEAQATDLILHLERYCYLQELLSIDFPIMIATTFSNSSLNHELVDGLQLYLFQANHHLAYLLLHYFTIAHECGKSDISFAYESVDIVTKSVWVKETNDKAALLEHVEESMKTLTALYKLIHECEWSPPRAKETTPMHMFVVWVIVVTLFISWSFGLVLLHRQL